MPSTEQPPTTDEAADQSDASATQRLENVEVKLMDVELSVTELNDVIIRQYQEIDSLKAALQRMQSQIDNLGTGDSDPAVELPPHY